MNTYMETLWWGSITSSRLTKYCPTSFADVTKRLQQLWQRVYQREATAIMHWPDAHQQRRPDHVQKLLLRQPGDGQHGSTLTNPTNKLQTICTVMDSKCRFGWWMSQNWIHKLGGCFLGMKYEQIMVFLKFKNKILTKLLQKQSNYTNIYWWANALRLFKCIPTAFTHTSVLVNKMYWFLKVLELTIKQTLKHKIKSTVVLFFVHILVKLIPPCWADVTHCVHFLWCK